MESHVHYTVVGIFVISLMTAIVFGIIWLSSGFGLDQYQNYVVYMQESVSGLNVDSAVEYNGVDVGTIKNIKLNPKNPQLVELLLSIKNSTPITRSTLATLNSRGFTGVAYLALKNKGNDLRPLIAKAGETYPVIPSGPSLFSRLDIALGQLSSNLQKVTTAIEGVLNKDNQKSIQGTLNNLEKITRNLVDNNTHLANILRNSEAASKQLPLLLQTTSHAAKTLELQTLPAVYHLLDKLEAGSRSLNDFIHNLKQNPSMLLRGQVPQKGPGES